MMKLLPWDYGVRNLLRRPLRTLLTALGLALVIFLLFLVVGFVRGRASVAQHVLSVCTGAFILHAAGLLKGRCATTHWKAMDQLRQLPGVTAVKQRWVRDGTVWTSAGVSAGMDLALGFIETVDGAKAAASVQKNAEYYPDGRIYGEEVQAAG